MTVSLNILADDAVDLIRQIRSLAGLPPDVIPVVRESSVSAAAVTAHIAASEAKEAKEAADLTPDAEDEVGKSKRTRRTKAEIEAARLAEAAQGAPAGEFTKADASSPEPVPTATEPETTAILATSAPPATEPETSTVDDDPFAPGPLDSGDEDPNTPAVSDYGLRLINFKAVNEGKTAEDFIKAELMRLADKHGGRTVKEGLDAIRDLMVRFGVPRVPQVPEADYPKLLRMIDEEMAK